MTKMLLLETKEMMIVEVRMLRKRAVSSVKLKMMLTVWSLAGGKNAQ